MAIAKTVAPYTPLIDENDTQLEVAFSDEDQGFLHKPSLQDAVKEPTVYTVQKGDTLTSIADKYGITTATILEANNITSTNMETINSGTTLTIPTYSTTDSLAWLDDLNKVKADQAAAAKKAQEEANKKKQLALASTNRNLAYRDTSTQRQTTTNGFTGNNSGQGMIVPISTKGISRGIVGGHTGIDYRADVGTPVSAAKDGTVVEITSGWAGGWGNSILLDHGGGVRSRYAHLSKVGVSIGQTVSQGTIIGYSGNTGFSTGPHLHFEVDINKHFVCPYEPGNAHRNDCFVKG